MARTRAAVVTALALLVPASAVADTWTVTGEVGAELDTNVQRVETGPGLDTAPVTSAVARLGVRADGAGELAGGTYTLALADLTRIVGDQSVDIEDVTALTGTLRWLHPVGARPVALGFGVIGQDALPLADAIGARTFSNFGGDALLAAHDGDTTHVLLAVGGRSFDYKPDPTYDWLGPTASARVDFTLWRGAESASSWQLSLGAGFEARRYNSLAEADGCAPVSPPAAACQTGLVRHDRFQRVGAELTWTGKQIASLGYELLVIDSNSAGESLVRHRGAASLTSPLPYGFYITGLAILQIDLYIDGLPVANSPLMNDFTNIEDENSSSLQIRLARQLTSTWTLEARAATWRNLGSSTMDLDYQRTVVYAGLVGVY